MSLYLGNQKVGVSYAVGEALNEGDEILSAANKAALKEAVEYRTNKFDPSTVPQMIAALKAKYFQRRQYDLFTEFHKTPWVRPQDWPNLDSLNLQMSGDDFIYMTYDNTGGRAAIALHVEKINNGTDISVEMGHISNGIYVADETITGTSNNYVRWLTSQDDDYIVVRVTGDIKYCYCYSVTQDGTTQHYRRQPIIERIAYVPHLIQFCTNGYNAWGTLTLQRDKVNNGDGNALTSLYCAWAYCRDLEDLDITGLKTQNLTSMDSTFLQCQKLKELDLSHFDTGKLKTMNSIFNTCYALRKIDLTGWETAIPTTLASTFNECRSLVEIKNIENLNTSNATTFFSTFSNCRSLPSLDVTKWNTSKVTTLYGTFNGCHSLEKLDLSTWDISNVTTFYGTFVYCYNLKTLNLNNWQCNNNITSVYGMFSACWSLETIDISWLNITSKCQDICYMFYNCWSLKELNFPTWDVSGIPDGNNRGHDIFANCYSLEKITGIKNWHWNMKNSLGAEFSNCYCLRELDVSGWIVNNATSLASMFNNCYSLKTLNLSSWNPENSTTLASMFSGCYSLITVGDISEWDTSKCTTMGSMFRYCYSLPSMPAIQNWDFSKVTSIGSIFSECTSLEDVEWKNINLPECTNIEQLFRYDYNLKSADLSGWSIPKVTNSASYYQTFGDCRSLRDLKGFPITTAYLNQGFQNCEALSYDSLMLIMNSLPTVSTTHTCRIPAISLNLLTAAEKAIATNKGWTLANS